MVFKTNVVVVLMQLRMQHQEIEALPSGSESESSEIFVFSGGHDAANKEKTYLLIDFENVEDILDFSVHSPSATPDNDKQYSSKLHRKMTAEKPVKLLDLKPKIDNYVNDGEVISEESHETELKAKKRFQCIYCGSKFVRSTHLYRHLRIHTGAKPYVCPICRKRFSRSDYMSAHVSCHRREKTHKCCVCGEVYHDLTRFAYHCRTHDDSEYMRLEICREHVEVQTAEKEITAAACKKEIEESCCITIERVDNSTTEECIECVENPLYLLHRPVIMININ